MSIKIIIISVKEMLVIKQYDDLTNEFILEISN